MPLAGEIIVAGQIPDQRIATAIATADSADFATTETVLMTVIAPVVAGRTYKVVFDGSIRGNVTGTNTVLLRIREDTVSGNQLQGMQYSTLANSTIGFGMHVESEYTADVTEDKTLVLTGIRNSGTATFALDAGAIQPNHLYVDYNRG